MLQALVEPVDDGTTERMPEASGSLDAKLGAIIGLRMLGPSGFKSLLGPIGMLTGSSNQGNVELVPLQVMGTWLAKLQGDDKTPKRVFERLVNDVKQGLRELSKDTGMAAAADPEDLRKVYGDFWVDLLSSDNDLLAVLSHYQGLSSTSTAD